MSDEVEVGTFSTYDLEVLNLLASCRPVDLPVEFYAGLFDEEDE
jgi:hypothetical protein